MIKIGDIVRDYTRKVQVITEEEEEGEEDEGVEEVEEVEEDEEDEYILP